MKKGYKLLILLPAALLILFGYNGCKEDDDYDFSKIEPVVKLVTGNATPMQGRHYEFTATTRGGSTYAWESAQNAEIVAYPGAVGNWKTYVYFPDVIPAGSADPEVISVVETTMGGVQSEPKTFPITNVRPFKALDITGSEIVNAGFTSAYSASPSASDKIYSTYTWESTAGTITPDAIAPWKMSISFTNDDVSDSVVIYLIEATTKGMKDTSEYVIEVLEYCALENGVEDLIGVWSGEDAYYDAAITTSAATGDSVVIMGVNSMFILDFWGEEVTDEGDVKMAINEDGTVEIPSQYLFTTSYDNAPYEYWIEGEGRWNNCGEYPTITFTYTVYNFTDDYTLPTDYSSYFGGDVVFSADLVMDGGAPPTMKAYREAMKHLTVKRPQIR